MNSSKKIFIAGGVLVLLALLAYVIGVPMWEQAQVEKMQSYLEKLPGNVKVEKVEVQFFGNKQILTGVTGKIDTLPGMDSLPSSPVISFSIGKIEASGVNFSAGLNKSVTHLADSLIFTDMKTEVSIEGMDQTTLLEEFALRNIQMDLGSFIEQVQKGENPVGFIAPLMTFKADSLSYKGYQVLMGTDGNILKMSLDSADAQDVGLLTSGPMKANNMKIAVMGMDIFGLEEMSAKRMRVPDLLTPILTLSDSPQDMEEQLPSIMLSKLAHEPIIIEGFTLKNLRLSGLHPEPITMDSATMDMYLGKDAVNFKTSVENLSLPSAILGMLGNELSALQAVYSKPLILSGTVDFASKLEAEQLGMDVKTTFSDKALGSAESSIALTSPAQGIDNVFEALGNADNHSLFKSASTTLTDNGFLAVLFDATYAWESSWGGMGEGIHSGADLRGAAANGLLSEAQASPTKEQTAILSGLGNFVQKGGKLAISIAATNPLPVTALSNLGGEGVTVVVEHSE